MSSANRKVLHIINGEHYSGAERVQDLLVQRLPDFGYEAWVACVKPDKFADRCACDKSRVREFPMGSRFDFVQSAAIAKFVNNAKFDLIHSHTPRTAYIGALVGRKTGRRLIHHVHSPTVRDSKRQVMNRVSAFVEQRVMERADQLIAVSGSLRSHLGELGLAQDKTNVVWNGVAARESLSDRLPPERAWTLGAVALFRPRKGLEVMLDALAMLRSEGFDVRLRAVGEFEADAYRSEIEQRVAELELADAVDWVGFVSDVAAEFEKMDLFVLPSLFGEGLPMVVLEAMACGVPIVSTAVEGVPEAVTDGQDGILVEAGRADSIADGVRKVITQPDAWTRLRTSAFGRQREHFSDISMARGVAEVYSRVLA